MKTPKSVFQVLRVCQVLLLGALLGALLWGCSSDGSGMAPTQPGDPDNHEYQSVNRVLGGEVFSLEGMHWHSLLEGELPGAVRSRSGAATPAHDTILSVTVTVDSATGWIVLAALAANHKDTAEILDSVRFYRNGVPTIPSDSLPGDSMSSVDVFIRGHVHANDSTQFVGTLEHASRINLAVLDRDPGLNQVTYQLNLTARDTLDGTAWDSVWGVCDVQVAASRTITDLIDVEGQSLVQGSSNGAQPSVWSALAAHEGCPLSGTVLLEMDVFLHCTGGEADVTVDAQWAAEAKFTGGDRVRVTFTSGGFYWSDLVECSELGEL